LYYREQEDGGEDNDGTYPKTTCHFIQVAKEKEGTPSALAEI
jgi:hypothetical protein